MFSIRQITVLVLAGLPIAMAHAQSGLTRDQVRHELGEARADGAIEVSGDLGGAARDRYPGLYPATTKPTIALSRAVVLQQLRVAASRGDVPHGDLDLVALRVTPDMNEAGVAGKTRAQVRAELALAIRQGDVEEIGDGGRLLRDVGAGRRGPPIDTVAPLHYASAGSY